jgi:hypothetical protein
MQLDHTGKISVHLFVSHCTHKESCARYFVYTLRVLRIMLRTRAYVVCIQLRRIRVCCIQRTKVKFKVLHVHTCLKRIIHTVHSFKTVFFLKTSITYGAHLSGVTYYSLILTTKKPKSKHNTVTIILLVCTVKFTYNKKNKLLIGNTTYHPQVLT